MDKLLKLPIQLLLSFKTIVAFSTPSAYNTKVTFLGLKPSWLSLSFQTLVTLIVILLWTVTLALLLVSLVTLDLAVTLLTKVPLVNVLNQIVNVAFSPIPKSFR